ncbi:MAG: penicillin-binding transpeptidase domain-containing protein [Acidobacteriota bacterium]
MSASGPTGIVPPPPKLGRRRLFDHGRLAFVVFLAGTWMALALGRLWSLQVDRHEHYAEAAQRQQQRVVELSAPRGTVYDARGRTLAASVEVASLGADPSLIDDPAGAAELLAPLLGLDAVGLAARLDAPSRFVWLQRKLDPDVEAQLRALREEHALRGLVFLTESLRSYPFGSLAAQVLGHVNVDNRGSSGLEQQYDEIVASRSGRRTVLRDGLRGTFLDPARPGEEADAGGDLHLTLDAAIQNIAERELEAAMAEHGSRAGKVVMLDPHTGAVLAMVSKPDFDPNRFFEADRRVLHSNPAVAAAFEPGSTLKMVTLAAALETGAVDPLRTYDCNNGSIVLGRGTRIRDHKPFGVLTVGQVIAKSSNIGAIRLGQAAGQRKLDATLRGFGFGQATGIDLPGEGRGLATPVDRWTRHQWAYVSFGQAIGVTALQLTNAFAAVANRGYLLRPYVVSAIGDREVASRRLTGVPISPSTVRQVRTMLETVVQEGTAKAAAVEGYRVAGKTGTAQKAREDGRGYAPDRYIASFVGFAPVSDPRLVMAVVIDEPWPRYNGGEVAAPVWSAIAEQTLLYLGVEPDAPHEAPSPSPRWTPPAPIESPPAMRLAGFEVDAAAAAEVAELRPHGEVDVPTPSFLGLTLRDALREAGARGLAPAVVGHGRVVEQRPAVGEPIDLHGRRLLLVLRPEIAPLGSLTAAAPAAAVNGSRVASAEGS